MDTSAVCAAKTWQVISDAVKVVCVSVRAFTYAARVFSQYSLLEAFPLRVKRNLSLFSHAAGAVLQTHGVGLEGAARPSRAHGRRFVARSLLCVI